MATKVAGDAARVALQVAKERLRPRPVLRAGEVPVGADRLEDAWLTATLCAGVPGAAVVGHDVVGGTDGTSSRRAIRVRYDAAGEAAGLPTHLFAKSAASLQSRLFLVLGGVAASETTFYRELRDGLPELRSPRAHVAAFDPRTFRSIVLLDDLTARGWTFPDPMSEGVSRRDAEDMVDQMAYYHAAHWNDPGLVTGRASLPTTHAFQTRLNGLGIARRAVVGIERGRDDLPASVYRRKRELVPTTMRALALNSAGVPTLLHQDVHQGNWLRDPDGRMGLYDWQAVARGEWALDVTYALAVNLAVEDRRAWERDLLGRYLERLGEHGVGRRPTAEEAWLRYRQQPFHVLIFALFTIGAGPFQPDMQPKAYMSRCLRRIATFIEDHESLDAIA